MYERLANTKIKVNKFLSRTSAPLPLHEARLLPQERSDSTFAAQTIRTKKTQAGSKKSHCFSMTDFATVFPTTYLRNVDRALPEEKLGNGVRDMHRPER